MIIYLYFYKQKAYKIILL